MKWLKSSEYLLFCHLNVLQLWFDQLSSSATDLQHCYALYTLELLLSTHKNEMNTCFMQPVPYIKQDARYEETIYNHV